MGNRQWQFKRYYFITSFALIFVLTVGMGVYFVTEKYKEFQQYALNDKLANIESKRLIMKSLVDSFIQQVNIFIEESESSLDGKLKNRVTTAHNIAVNMYEQMHGRYEDSDIKAALKAALSAMVFGSDYVFCMDHDGVIISSPLLKHIEGKNLIDTTDSEGNYTLRDAIKIADGKGEGYQNVYWIQPGDEQGGLKRKRVFLKKFEPFNWIIGYGEYTDEFAAQVQKDAVHMLEGVSYENEGYLFAATYDGVSLTKPAKGKKVYDVRDANGKYVVRELIKKAQHGGGYMFYVMPPFKGARPENKLSYVAPIENWNWYVGAGMYLTDIEAAYEKRLDSLYSSARREVLLIIAGMIILLGIASVAISIFSGKLQRLVNVYSDEINMKNDELEDLNLLLEEKVLEKTKELNDLNQLLEHKVAEEVNKNREKDRIMFQQGRLAAMGEMIGNIAHQWRQPLSSISLLIQDIQEAAETGELNEEYLSSTVEKCTQTITHMSETIDNFRDFFRPDKIQTDISVNTEINKCLQLLEAGLENNNIKVITNLGSDCIIHGVTGEYSQVIVNIISNAKDVLCLRAVSDPEIVIESLYEDEFSVVRISDNAGGVSSEIIDRIFEPYFTTKSVSQGTGIGLYFSKMIIEGNMSGNLSVNNSEKGACFTIRVPEMKKTGNT